MIQHTKRLSAHINTYVHDQASIFSADTINNRTGERLIILHRYDY